MKGGIFIINNENPIKLKGEENVEWDLDPMVDIIFKSIFRKDEKRYLVKVLMKELFEAEVSDIEERDSYFIAKGKNKKGSRIKKKKLLSFKKDNYTNRNRSSTNSF